MMGRLVGDILKEMNDFCATFANRRVGGRGVLAMKDFGEFHDIINNFVKQLGLPADVRYTTWAVTLTRAKDGYYEDFSVFKLVMDMQDDKNQGISRRGKILSLEFKAVIDGVEKLTIEEYIKLLSKQELDKKLNDAGKHVSECYEKYVQAKGYELELRKRRQQLD